MSPTMNIMATKKNQPSTEKVKAPAHYVDNKKFYDALVEHINAYKLAEAEGKEPPLVSNYIGECFLKIATHLSYKSNFINYTFKDDMISDGIENCLAAADKFDPVRSTNPFAYYTQITFYAFVRRIQKEKKQQVTKFKIIENMDIEGLISQDPDSHAFANEFLEYLRKQVDYVDIDKRTISAPKKKVKLAEELPIELDPEE